MPASILVATPHVAFGELLRLSLEEHGHYQVRLVRTAKEARASLSRYLFQLVIVDYTLEDEPFVSFCFELIAQLSGVRVVVIPPDNNPNHTSLGGLIPHGYLNRPFYLPDLLELTERLLSEVSFQPPLAPKEPDVPIPSWLNDTILLQGYLEKELEASEAVAALVGQGGKLRANAGRLPLPAAQEMANMLLRYWNREDKTDLMRFIRLSSIKGDYLVYVTEVLDGIILIMAYTPGASISQVRPQTLDIAKRMATTPPPGYQENMEVVAESTPALTGSKNGAERKPGADLLGTQNRGRQEADSAKHRLASLETETEPIQEVQPEAPIFEEPEHTTKLPKLSEENQDYVDSEEAVPQAFDLSMLLGTVPSPDPQDEDLNSSLVQSTVAMGWMRETNLWDSNAEYFEEEKPSDITPQETKTDLQVPPVPVDTESPLGLLEADAEIDPLSDTRPHVLSTVNHISQLEPISPALSLLNYTCVLIPRLPQHYLTGELADKLAMWVQQFCLAFGWRLEGISIRPDYMQWTVQVAPSVSPGNLVRIIRQRTSSSIFNTFEHLKAQNPSGDFWAIGYLIVSGSQPPSAQLLRDYISQTRKRQGITKL